MVKRFLIETTTAGQRFRFITEHPDSKLYFATVEEDPILEFGYMSNRQKVTETLQPAEFIEVKGWKAIGNKLIDKKIISIQPEQSGNEDEGPSEAEEEVSETPAKGVQADLFGAPPAQKSKSTAKHAPKATSKTKPKSNIKPASKGGGGKPKKKSRKDYLETGDTIEFDFE
jgi:topoisomerase-4 subunit A